MAHYSLSCTSCGKPTTASRKDAKVCPSCRIRQNLRWATDKYRRARKCRACGQKYRAYHGKDLISCVDCLLEHSAHKFTVGTCVFCDKDRHLAHPAVPLCLHCLKSPDPDLRDSILGSLNGGFRQRCQQHSDTLASPQPITRTT